MIEAELKGQALNQSLVNDVSSALPQAREDTRTEKPAPGGPDLEAIVSTVSLYS